MAQPPRSRFFASTRGRVVLLLRYAPRTVNELVAALKLTDNAVRFQLASLQRDGLVQASGWQRGSRKPNVIYALTEEAAALFSQPYAAVLDTLLHVLRGRLTAGRRRALLRACGHRLARGLAKQMPKGGVAERSAAAVRILNELGGLSELTLHEGDYVIRGRDCPLRGLVPAHPEVCVLAETLVGDLVGEPVREECEKGTRPQCRFRILTKRRAKRKAKTRPPR
jgi:predicted ArsR family transcriptional regulator